MISVECGEWMVACSVSKTRACSSVREIDDGRPWPWRVDGAGVPANDTDIYLVEYTLLAWGDACTLG